MIVKGGVASTEPLRKTEVDDPEVVVVVGVGEHDVERLEVKVEDPLAVDELDSPENDGVEKKHGGKVKTRLTI